MTGDAGSGYRASRVVAPDGASPAERRFMHVATPAVGGSLDCSFDKIHNLIISYNVYVFVYICIYSNISNLK